MGCVDRNRGPDGAPFLAGSGQRAGEKGTNEDLGKSNAGILKRTLDLLRTRACGKRGCGLSYLYFFF